VLLDQPFDPEANGAGQYGKGGYGDLTTALPPAASVRPREKSEDASRTSLLVTEVEVVRRRIVEIHRALDEPQTKNAGVEVEIPLRVTGDTGDVMNTGSAEAHRPDSCLAILRTHTLIAVGLLRAFSTLFRLSSGCHNISNLYPSIKATDMPFAEALM